MEQKSVSIYHTCTVQHIKELIPLLKMMIGNNLPQTELNVTAEGSIYFKNRLAWELPLNQQSPRNEREAKEAAEYWLKEVRKREANAKTLYQHTQNKAESYLPLFFHTNWTFLKALPEYSDKNLLRYWKVIYSLKLTSIEGLPKGEARVVPDHQLVLYIKYKNPSLLPAIDYISRPIFKAEAVQSLLHFEEADIPNLRMIENAANHTISPYKMADDGNWVAMTEVGAERIDIGNKVSSILYGYCPPNFEDYLVFVDVEFRKMNFFLNIYYNTNNEKIRKRITTDNVTEQRLDLSIVWNEDKYKKGIRVKQMKLSDFQEQPKPETTLFNALNHTEKDIYWTLNFKVNLIPYEGPPFNEKYIDDYTFATNYEKEGKEPNPERKIVDGIREMYMSNYILSYKKSPPELMDRENHIIALEDLAYGESETSFSHEIGHVWGLGEAKEINHVQNTLWKKEYNRKYGIGEIHYLPSYLMSWDTGNREIQDFELESMLIFMIDKIEYFRVFNTDSAFNTLWGIVAKKSDYVAYPLDFLHDTKENTQTLRKRLNDIVPRRY